MAPSRRFVSWLAGASALGLVAGCGPEPTPKPAPTPPWQSLPVAACGMAKYQLLDPATLGEPGASEEIPLLYLDAAAANALLGSTGYTALLPLPYGSRVFRYRYTTQDRGRRIEATATLAVPNGVDLSPTTPLPVTLFLHGTTGFSDVCSPGRSLDGQSAGAVFAALGFVAILPDYIGLDSFGDASTAAHAYLVGEQAALGSWDAVRAGLKLVKSLDLGVEASTRVVVWGGSQGGHAALFSERYAPYYAPEFEVPAVVALVAPTALVPLTKIAVSSFSPPTIALASALATMRKWYATPDSLAGILTDAAPYHFASTIEDQLFVKNACGDTGKAYQPIDQNPAEQQPSTVYAAPFIDAAKNDRLDALPPWGCFLEENSLATSSVKPLRQTPTLMAYSEDDELVVTAPMRDAFDTLCRAGARLTYLECAGATHTEGALWSLPEQVAWIRERLAGKPVLDGCTRHAPVCCSATPKDRCTP